MIPTKELCKIILTSLEENKLEKFKAYLSSNESSEEAFNATTLTTLLNILKKNGKREEKIMHVDCVLSCLEHFIQTSVNPQKWDILADDVGKLCELLFVISSTFLKDASLIQKNINTFANLAYRKEVIAESVLRFTMDSLIKVATSDVFSSATKLSILTTISCMISLASREARREIFLSKVSSLNNLSNILCVCGDYEMQVTIVDILARSWHYLKDRYFRQTYVPDVNVNLFDNIDDANVNLFTDFPDVMKKFQTYTFEQLDIDGRSFLNSVNNDMGDNQVVFSIPCLLLTIDDARYMKPANEMYSEFWIDFNLKSKRLSFYYQNNSDEFWELMAIMKSEVLSAEAKNSICKRKDEDIIPVAKMQITFKKDSNKPKLLKVYFRKSKEYQMLEKRVVVEIFGDKFKTAVTFDDIDVSQIQPEMKLKSVNHYTKVGKAKKLKIFSNKYKRLDVSVLQNKSLSTIFELNEPIQQAPPSINSAVTSQQLNETTMEESRMDRSNPAEDPELSEEDLSNSDSFSRYLKELKNQEKNAQIQNEQLILDDAVKNIRVKDEPEVKDNNIGIQPLTEDSEQMEINDLLDKKIMILPIGNMENSKTCSKITMNNNNISEEKDDENKTKKRVKSLSNLQNNCNTVKKRRLFSSERNTINDIILSSLEETAAEIPKYNFRKKKDHKIEPLHNVDRKNITYSYIKEKENIAKPQARNSKLFLEMSDEEEDLMMHGTDDLKVKDENDKNRSSVLTFADSDKKLLALNCTPEGVEGCGIFPPKSPNLFILKKDTHLKKTYARPKPKKTIKKKTVMEKSDLSSDYDSDYVPKVKSHPKVNSCQRKTERIRPRLRLGNLFSKTAFLVDPIRDVDCLDVDFNISPSNLKELDLPRKIEVPSVIDPFHPDFEDPKNNKVQKTNSASSRNKKSPKVVTNNAQKKKSVRKPRGAKCVKTCEMLVENDVKDVSLPTNDINCQSSEANKNCDDDHLAIDVPTSIYQNSDLPSAATLTLFGKHCLTETNTRMKSILTLAEKERDNHYSSYSLKAHETFTTLQQLRQKHMVISNNIHKVKCLLDTIVNIQNEVSTDIEEISKQHEETRLLLKENLSKVEQTQSLQFIKMYQDLEKKLNTLSMSFIQKNSVEKDKYTS